MNPSALFNLSYGVYVVSTWDEGRPTGCIANSAMQITSAPATIAVSINHDNYTNLCIKNSGRFAISVLGENSQPGLIGTFGFQSGRSVNKFDEVEHAVKGYLPVVADACAYIACEVIDQMETDTHTVFLGKVSVNILGDAHTQPFETRPLSFCIVPYGRIFQFPLPSTVVAPNL